MEKTNNNFFLSLSHVTQQCQILSSVAKNVAERAGGKISKILSCFVSKMRSRLIDKITMNREKILRFHNLDNYFFYIRVLQAVI